MNQLTPTVKQMFSLINDGLNCDHASATFCLNDKGEWMLVNRPYSTFAKPFRDYYCTPAFTLADLLQMLPPTIGDYKLSVTTANSQQCVRYDNPVTGVGLLCVYRDTRLDAVLVAIEGLMTEGLIDTTKTFNYDERIVPLKCSVAR